VKTPLLWKLKACVTILGLIMGQNCLTVSDHWSTAWHWFHSWDTVSLQDKPCQGELVYYLLTDPNWPKLVFSGHSNSPDHYSWSLWYHLVNCW